MKKMTLLATVVSAMMFGVAAQANPTAAPDGTITIKGKIVDNTCTVTTATKDKTVTLPTVAVSAFTAADQSVAPTAFQIGLENCKAGTATNGTSVRLFFTPANIVAFNQTKGVLNNTYQATGGKTAANGVGIQLLTKNREHIPVGKDYAAYTQTGDKTTLAQGNVFMDYFAAYYSIDRTVTAGEVEATVTYNIVYD